MKGTYTLRMYMSDWKKIRQIFPGEVNESVAHYLERFVRYLQQLKFEGKL